MLKEQSPCTCIDLLVSCVLKVENICAPEAGWAGKSEMLSLPTKYWVPSSLCRDKNRVFPS